MIEAHFYSYRTLRMPYKPAHAGTLEREHTITLRALKGNAVLGIAYSPQ